jgi:hypothetical protein
MTTDQNRTCCECGKRYKRPLRRRTREEDAGGEWRAYPVCKRCWSGVLLVDSDQAPLCDYCHQPDCVREEWEDGVCAQVRKHYPNGQVLFAPRVEWDTLRKTQPESSGYEACPDGIWDPDLICYFAGGCLNDEAASSEDDDNGMEVDVAGLDWETSSEEGGNRQ